MKYTDLAAIIITAIHNLHSKGTKFPNYRMINTEISLLHGERFRDSTIEREVRRLAEEGILARSRTPGHFYLTQFGERK